ncbi:hypothetical protein WA1_42935 [Scytonema hofmannii PCC 7110]|uniref:VWA containing CoxE family protein n=1 Tax=Scytonema hofmannii PCC 7110 TaxID=128403 RepID=A0A139WVK9_9CYAN|nr:hypothetical protein [Scytonema hofmannii]KYC36461.1 hypothetical protein WA1_42935 [Scytonema hofmannii PCC 7110]
MSEGDLPLYELFTRLREAKFLLGVGDYNLLLEVLLADYGTLESEILKLDSPSALKQLCQTLWVKSVSQQRQFEAIFEEMFGEKVERSHSPTIHPPKEEQTASVIATPEEAPQKSTTTKKSRSKKPHFFFAPAPSHSIETTTQETEVAKAVRVGKPREWTAFKPSGLPKDYFPVTARQMEQGWYTLRRPIRKGLRLELDVPATIDQIKQRGMFFQPIQKPRQVKSSHLVLLIDQKGSMQPFHVLSRLLVETAYQTSCLEKTDCYYFNNYPRFMLYGDSQFQTESPVEEVIARWHPEKTVILILSDAGAARGNFVLRRVERTLEFLEKLQHYSKAIAWLNPVPQASWKRTTAQAIAEAKIVPMFSCDRVGFQKAMKVLQGISQLQVYQVAEEATTEEKDELKAELETDPDIEYALKRIHSFARRFTQAHLDLAYHAAFPLTLTPDFLYRLRDYLIELDLQIPWIAVSDLLLSGDPERWKLSEFLVLLSPFLAPDGYASSIALQACCYYICTGNPNTSRTHG